MQTRHPILLKKLLPIHAKSDVFITKLTVGCPKCNTIVGDARVYGVVEDKSYGKQVCVFAHCQKCRCKSKHKFRVINTLFASELKRWHPGHGWKHACWLSHDNPLAPSVVDIWGLLASAIAGMWCIQQSVGVLAIVSAVAAFGIWTQSVKVRLFIKRGGSE